MTMMTVTDDDDARMTMTMTDPGDGDGRMTMTVPDDGDGPDGERKVDDGIELKWTSTSRRNGRRNAVSRKWAKAATEKQRNASNGTNAMMTMV